MAKICILDIETSPSLAHIWRMWQENISPKQLILPSKLMSVAYKWLDDGTVYYEECRNGKDERLVKSIVKVLDEADIVIAHNAKKFDLPTINARAISYGISPPAPYKVVDTLLAARKHFRFPHNSLEGLANYLGCSPKKTHKNFPGFELWAQCLLGNKEAWLEMKEYNIQDVVALEEVYLKMRPWMSQHPNLGVFIESEVPVCPKCGGKDIHFRGYATTNTSKFHRFRCNTCGGWGRLRANQFNKEARQALAANVAD